MIIRIGRFALIIGRHDHLYILAYRARTSRGRFSISIPRARS